MRDSSQESRRLFGFTVLGTAVRIGNILICLAGVPTTTSLGQEAALREFKSADDAYGQGVAHFNAGQYELAIQAFSAAIEGSPKFAEAYEYRGRAHTKISEEATDIGQRDIAFLRAIEDRQTAGEIRASRELGLEFDRYTGRYAAILVTYVICWVVLIYYWRTKQLSGGWLVVAFLTGPLGLVFVFLLGLTAPPTEPLDEDQPFSDSELEQTLQSRRRIDDEPEEVSELAPCPNCGRENSTRTKICPRCENRLS